MQIEAMVRAVQAKLGVGVDGRAGPETWSAIYKRIVDRGSPADLALTETADRANARSERVIATLHATRKHRDQRARRLFQPQLRHRL